MDLNLSEVTERYDFIENNFSDFQVQKQTFMHTKMMLKQTTVISTSGKEHCRPSSN